MGETGIEREIAGEKAASLGRAGKAVAESLAALRALPQGADRSRVAQRAADAVHALLIQRESCGLRDERAVFRDYQVPGEVIVRIGAIPRPE